MSDKFYKDAANYFTLFVDQGADYKIEIPYSSFNRSENILELQLFASIRKSPQSKKEFEMRAYVDGLNIVIEILNDTTSSLKSKRFVFDVMAKTNTKTFLLAAGDIEVNNTSTRI